MLPKHKLEAALKTGTLDTALGPVDAAVGDRRPRPVRAERLQPGPAARVRAQPALLAARTSSGAPLPYLDRADRSKSSPRRTRSCCASTSGAERHRRSARCPSEAYATVKRAADAGKLRLYDLGVGLRRRRASGSTSSRARSRPIRARRGCSATSCAARSRLAVDRQLFADTVFLGAGLPVFGPDHAGQQDSGIRPRRRRRRTIRRRRRALLASIGLADRNGDGVLEDASGRPAQFTLLTQKGRPSLERGVSVIRDELKKIGIVVDVVALDGGARHRADHVGEVRRRVLQRRTSTRHRSGQQPRLLAQLGQRALLEHRRRRRRRPTWEARIDELMARQMQSLDDRRAQAAVRRGAEDLRRAPAGDLLRRAAHVRRRVDARDQRDAGRAAPAAAVVAGHGGGRQVGACSPTSRGGSAFAVFLVFAVSSASLVLARLAPGDYVTESLGLGARAGSGRRGARALRPESIDRRAVPRLDRRRRAPRLRTVAAVRPAGRGSHPRARRQHGHPGGDGAGRCHAHRPAARRRHRQPPARRRCRTRSGRCRSCCCRCRRCSRRSSWSSSAARTGWLPVGGMTSSRRRRAAAPPDRAGAALALPLVGDVRAPAVAGDERSRSASRTCWRRSAAACRCRASIWRDALEGRAAARSPSVYGLVVGTLLSGSFAVETITAWPGLGQLMLDGASRARRVSRRRLRRGRVRSSSPSAR